MLVKENSLDSLDKNISLNLQVERKQALRKFNIKQLALIDNQPLDTKISIFSGTSSTQVLYW